MATDTRTDERLVPCDKMGDPYCLPCLEHIDSAKTTPETILHIQRTRLASIRDRDVRKFEKLAAKLGRQQQPLSTPLTQRDIDAAPWLRGADILPLGLSPSLSSTPSSSGSGKCSNRMAEYADKRAVLSVNRASVDQVALVRLTERGKICLSHTADGIRVVPLAYNKGKRGLFGGFFDLYLVGVSAHQAGADPRVLDEIADLLKSMNAVNVMYAKPHLATRQTLDLAQRLEGAFGKESTATVTGWPQDRPTVGARLIPVADTLGKYNRITGRLAHYPSVLWVADLEASHLTDFIGVIDELELRENCAIPRCTDSRFPAVWWEATEAEMLVLAQRALFRAVDLCDGGAKRRQAGKPPVEYEGISVLTVVFSWCLHHTRHGGRDILSGLPFHFSCAPLSPTLVAHITHGTPFASGFTTRTPNTLSQFEEARCNIRPEPITSNWLSSDWRYAGLLHFFSTIQPMVQHRLGKWQANGHLRDLVLPATFTMSSATEAGYRGRLPPELARLLRARSRACSPPRQGGGPRAVDAHGVLYARPVRRVRARTPRRHGWCPSPWCGRILDVRSPHLNKMTRGNLPPKAVFSAQWARKLFIEGLNARMAFFEAGVQEEHDHRANDERLGREQQERRYREERRKRARELREVEERRLELLELHGHVDLDKIYQELKTIDENRPPQGPYIRVPATEAEWQAHRQTLAAINCPVVDARGAPLAANTTWQPSLPRHMSRPASRREPCTLAEFDEWEEERKLYRERLRDLIGDVWYVHSLLRVEIASECTAHRPVLHARRAPLESSGLLLLVV